MGFIDNDHDVTLLENKQDAIAKAIARGVTDYEIYKSNYFKIR